MHDQCITKQRITRVPAYLPPLPSRPSHDAPIPCPCPLPTRHPPPPNPLQDLALALQLLDEAARRLEQSISFQRGSEEPLLALGDVLLERGEKLATAGDSSAAAAALQRALSEGYQQAQRIRAGSPEAAMGVADVQVQLARLAGSATASAAEHWAAAEAGYRVALQQHGTAFDFGERCNARYNHACCLARCGRVGEAAALLRQLLAVGAVTQQDIAQDADLVGVAL